MAQYKPTTVRRRWPPGQFMPVAAVTLVCAAVVSAGQFNWSRAETGEELSGGKTTVFETSRRAFSLPAANIPTDRRGKFAVGHSFFNMSWVEAPASTRIRDGLGPHFIGRSCTACHTHDGRASPPEDGEQPMGLLRLSILGRDKVGAICLQSISHNCPLRWCTMMKACVVTIISFFREAESVLKSNRVLNEWFEQTVKGAQIR